MKRKFLFTVIMGLSVLLSSCEKEPIEEKLEKTITGKWIVKSGIAFGTNIPGDGSYLKFNECSDVCSGEDYEATNQTSGLIIYELSQDEKTLNIEDIMDEGGNWNGKWNVISFTNTYLEISMNTLFGPVTFKLNKQ